jgi:hypothetical protein
MYCYFLLSYTLNGPNLKNPLVWIAERSLRLSTTDENWWLHHARSSLYDRGYVTKSIIILRILGFRTPQHIVVENSIDFVRFYGYTSIL